MIATHSSPALKLIAAFMLVTSLWSVANAQIPPCIIACVQPIAIQNGCRFQNTTCVCGNAKFQTEAAACLKANCTADENQQALQLQKQQCVPLGITATTPPPGPSTSVSVVTAATTAPTRASNPPPVTAGATSTGTTTGTAPASSQSNAAWATLPTIMNFSGIMALFLILGSMYL